MSKSPKRESYLAKQCLSWLNCRLNTLFFKVHGGPFQAAGVSDLIGLVNGRFVAIELKVGSNKPTKLQSFFICTVKQAGGIAEVCYTLDEVKAVWEKAARWH
ncbi:MAG: VRR-NUC domain-containing protein [Sedimentisphaerales bacterium]|nr:VRR-NUC domain-containing protein [Sedimentisphaerales bacterium]